MSSIGAVAGALLLGAIAAIVLAVAASAGPSATDALSAATPLRCVTGRAAQNPTVADQRDPSRRLTLPTNQTFATVEEAEAFICLRVPQPRDTGDWSLVSVRAERSHSLAQFLNGTGYRALDIFYRNDALHLAFDLHVTPSRTEIEGSGPPRPFAIGDIQGKLYSRPSDAMGPGVFTLTWTQAGFSFMAMGTGAVPVEAILPVLESIR